MSSYDQWKLAGPEPCFTCDDNGYESCDEHDSFEDGPDPDREWDERFED